MASAPHKAKIVPFKLVDDVKNAVMKSLEELIKTVVDTFIQNIMPRTQKTPNEKFNHVIKFLKRDVSGNYRPLHNYLNIIRKHVKTLKEACYYKHRFVTIADIKYGLQTLSDLIVQFRTINERVVHDMTKIITLTTRTFQAYHEIARNYDPQIEPQETYFSDQYPLTPSILKPFSLFAHPHMFEPILKRCENREDPPLSYNFETIISNTMCLIPEG